MEEDPRTQDELDKIREKITLNVARLGLSAGDECDDCPTRFTCPFVYDPYNTNGDCLAEK